MATRSNEKQNRRQLLVLAGVLLLLLAGAWLVDAPGRWLRSIADRQLIAYNPQAALVWCQRARQYGRDDAATCLLYVRANLQLNMTRVAAEWSELARRRGAAAELVALYEQMIAAQRGSQSATAQLLSAADAAPLPNEATEAILRGLQLSEDYSTCNAMLDALESAGQSLPIVFYHRGRNSEVKLQLDRAVDNYQQAFELQPNLTRAAIRAAECCRQLRDFEAAEQFLRQVADSPYADIVSIELADCLWEQNRLVEAQQMIQPVLDSSPRATEIMYFQLDQFVDIDRAALVAAQIADALDDSQSTVELAKRVLDYNHRNFEARALLIKNLRLLGRVDESQRLSVVQDQMTANRQRCRQLRIELDANQDDLARQFELAELYWTTESAAEAKLMLGEILQADAAYGPALELLEKIQLEENGGDSLANRPGS